MQIFKVKVCNNPQNGFLLERNKRKKTSPKGSLFCCQTRIRRSDCAYCNDCRSATLGKRTPSLSPSKRAWWGPLFDGFESMNLSTKQKTSQKGSLLFCCQTRIRTQTDRTRICSATVTPFGKIRLSAIEYRLSITEAHYFTRRSGIRAFLPVRARK